MDRNVCMLLGQDMCSTVFERVLEGRGRVLIEATMRTNVDHVVTEIISCTSQKSHATPPPCSDLGPIGRWSLAYRLMCS